MNIILFCSVILFSLTMKMKYRPVGKISDALFAVTMLSALISLFTVNEFSCVRDFVFLSLNILCCAATVFLYKTEILYQLEERAERAEAKARRIAAARAARRNQQALIERQLCRQQAREQLAAVHATMTRRERMERVSILSDESCADIAA